MKPENIQNYNDLFAGCLLLTLTLIFNSLPLAFVLKRHYGTEKSKYVLKEKLEECLMWNLTKHIDMKSIQWQKHRGGKPGKIVEWESGSSSPWDMPKSSWLIDFQDDILCMQLDMWIWNLGVTEIKIVCETIVLDAITEPKLDI